MVVLGKRKGNVIVANRRALGEDKSPVIDAASSKDHNDLFRKYFESRFEPLSPLEARLQTSEHDDTDSENEQITRGHEALNDKVDEDGDDDDDDDGDADDDTASEFSGFSTSSAQSAGRPIVEVIEVHATSQDAGTDAIEKIFKKSFMSSKPPQDPTLRLSQLPKSSKSGLGGAGSDAEDEEEETTNLKHDLDLQRLLRESHLLSQTRSQAQSTMLTATGKQRHQATDLQMLNLGSKASLYTQEKMPMSHRKGIQQKGATRDMQRRKEARENGVILEKERTSKTRLSERKRDRGVDAPGVGRFRGGTLSLSRKDISSIQGPSTRGVGKKRGRGRGRGRG